MFSLMIYMDELKKLLKDNKKWSERMHEQDPRFFSAQAIKQKPQYLWIGCSDSRVPANQVIGLLPGHLFVHRNIANQVIHTDLNCLSVVQYAVEALKVKHIIVCGHYGCGGVQAALTDARLGLVDNWVLHIRDIYLYYQKKIHSFTNKEVQHNKLCEINVVEQVRNLCRTSIVRDAWKKKQKLTVHGWIYGIKDGILRDMKMSIDTDKQVNQSYKKAADRIFAYPDLKA